MIKQITTKQDKEHFRLIIKKNLRKVIANIDEDDSYSGSFWLYNDKDAHCILLKQHYTFSELNLFINSNGIIPIVIGDFYHYCDYLNKATTDRELERFANKIIKEYNERVRERKLEEWWNKLYEKGMIEEEEDGGWHYTDKYYEKHRR